MRNSGQVFTILSYDGKTCKLNSRAGEGSTTPVVIDEPSY